MLTSDIYVRIITPIAVGCPDCANEERIMKLTKLNIPALRNLLRSEILNDGDKCMIDIAIFALGNRNWHDGS